MGLASGGPVRLGTVVCLKSSGHSSSICSCSMGKAKSVRSNLQQLEVSPLSLRLKSPSRSAISSKGITFSSASSSRTKKGASSPTPEKGGERQAAAPPCSGDSSGEEGGMVGRWSTVILRVRTASSGSGWQRSQAEALRRVLSLPEGRERKLWIISKGLQGSEQVGSESMRLRKQFQSGLFRITGTRQIRVISKQPNVQTPLFHFYVRKLAETSIKDTFFKKGQRYATFFFSLFLANISLEGKAKGRRRGQGGAGRGL